MSSSSPSPPTPPAGKVGALVVAGVSGSGKSTVGLLVAKRLGWVFVDGDDLHPWRNVYAMHNGRALTDEPTATPGSNAARTCWRTTSAPACRSCWRAAR